ncbi:ESX secretion-associated protein EspG [Actinoalloteichus spitiensis]|uniref:ESX secretion-associated protein EspG n=1 Tax=Actinoalloteichus spitiensis TaxID=252394 RepID=UPI000378EDC5|nr:ESX secretion-associated protein EspG [Actinoalloteichus spitiensis]
MSFSFRLTAQQYDILWEDGDLGRHPYPLRVRSHGATMDERADIRRRVYNELAAAGLGDGIRASTEVEDALLMMARPPLAIDMIWMTDPREQDGHQALLVAGNGEVGYRVRGELGGGIRIEEIRASSLVYSALALLPEAPAAPIPSVTLPMPAAEPPPAPGRHRRDDELGEDHSFLEQGRPGVGGAQGSALRSLERVFEKPRVRTGQIGVTMRDRMGRTARAPMVQWSDTEEGRILSQVSESSSGRVANFFGADHRRFAQKLGEVITALREGR